MSADLFAQFGGGNAPSNQQGQPKQTQAQDDDPFAFLSAALSQTPQTPQPQQPQPAPAQTQAAWPSFDAPLQPSQPSQPTQPALDWGSPTATFPAPAQTAVPATTDYDEEDTWGDFEDGSAQPPSVQPSFAPQPPSNLFEQTSAQPPIRAGPVRAPTIDLLSNTLISFGDAAPAASVSPQPQSITPTPQLQAWTSKPPEPANVKKPTDPDVLFDADDYDGNESSDEDDDGDDGDDDDEFGDFETGDYMAPQPTISAGQPTPSAPAPSHSSAAPPSSSGNLVDLLSLSDFDQGPTLASPTLPLEQSFGNLNLGFSQNQATSGSLSRPIGHLSPLDFGSTATPVGAADVPKSPSFQDRNPFPGLAVTTPLSAQFPSEKVQNRTPSPVTTWPTFESPIVSQAPTKGKAQPSNLLKYTDDDWGAWDAVDPEPAKPASKPASKPAAKAAVSAKPKAKSNKPAPESAASGWDWGEDDSPAPDSSSADLPSGIANQKEPKNLPDGAPPPTNVPPPAILLSLFPELMALPEETLFKPLASQPTEVRNRVLGHPKTVAFLRNYLQIIAVAVRVVAGRRQRWHRDKFLSQSMSISAAGSSKGGGMKLAGIDKTQNQREDREAADVVSAWRRYVGKLRTAVATVNAALVAAEEANHKYQPPLKIPELQSETVPVTTAKHALTAPRPCVVCGLRRDERVRGVDGDDVQDAFGEWWVEHWGHRACRNFWVEHEATLRSR